MGRLEIQALTDEQLAARAHRQQGGMGILATLRDTNCSPDTVKSLTLWLRRHFDETRAEAERRGRPDLVADEDAKESLAITDVSADTYPIPKHGWTCFFCGENFKTSGGARDHFGATVDQKPGCMVRVQLGAERGLLMALRKVEEELATLYRERADEDSALHRHIHSLQSRHSGALENAEIAGYERGLRAGQQERQQ